MYRAGNRDGGDDLPPNEPFIASDEEEEEEQPLEERLTAYGLHFESLPPFTRKTKTILVVLTSALLCDGFSHSAHYIDRNKLGGYYEDHAGVIKGLVKEKRRRRAGADPPEASRMHGEAIELFTDGKLDEALTRLQALVVEYPNLAVAYKSLGLVHENRKEWHEAATNYEIAGDKLKEPGMWTQAAHLYKQLGDTAKAFTCFGKAAKHGSVDLDAFQQRAQILMQSNQPKKALHELLAARKVPAHVHNIELLKEIARIYDHNLGEVSSAVEILAEAYKYMVENLDRPNNNLRHPALLDHDLVLAYSRLLARQNEWDKVLPIIEYADRKRGMAPLPVEIPFLATMTRINLHGLHAGRNQLHRLLLEQSAVEYGDLFLELANCLMNKEEWAEALNVLSHLRSNPVYEAPVVWSKIAQCQHHLGNLTKATEFYEMSFEHDKSDVDACLALSQIYDENNQPERAIQVVEEYERVSGEKLPTLDASARLPREMMDFGAQSSQEAPAAPAPRADLYDQREAQLKVMLRKARLLLTQGMYDQYVNIMTEFLSNQDIIFNRRRRRRIGSKRSPLEHIAAAVKRKGRKSKNAETPLDSLGAGITSVGSRAPTMDEFGEDEYQEEDDVIEEIEMAPPKARRGGEGNNPKKRKHVEIESGPPQVTLDEGTSNEQMMTSYNPGGGGWVVPSAARLQEMNARRNMWELCGMSEFCNIVIDYCKCLVYLNRTTEQIWKIVDTIYSLVFQEIDFLTESAELRCDLRFHVAQVAYSAGKYDSATQLTRLVCHTYPNNPHVWNFFFKCVSRTRQFYLSRSFCSRLVAKHPDCLPLLLLTGHLSLMSGSFQFAITSYLKGYQQDPNVPITLLCTAVGYINRSMSRSNPNHNGAVMKAFAFFYRYYIEQVFGGRGGAHEATYNLARAFHHLSLYQYAIPLYKKVLTDTNLPVLRLSPEEKDHYVATLQREAAYNLALIYRSSGAHHLARQLMMYYLTF